MSGPEQAYAIFRGGFNQNAPPHWNDLEPWQRDAMAVCYLHGTQNGPVTKVSDTTPSPEYDWRKDPTKGGANGGYY